MTTGDCTPEKKDCRRVCSSVAAVAHEGDRRGCCGTSETGRREGKGGTALGFSGLVVFAKKERNERRDLSL